jgi:hypothetical protein
VTAPSVRLPLLDPQLASIGVTAIIIAGGGAAIVMPVVFVQPWRLLM